MRVKLSGIKKRYGSNAVLSEFELDIHTGEFVAIVGASGAGKSTALRIIAGLEEPDLGWVELDGRRTSGLNPEVRVMFQDARLLPWRRVAGNVAIGLPRDRLGRALTALDMVGLADRADDWPAILSGGQRQRVALARALATNPRLMLLDEPLGSLDALTRIEMQRLIEQIWLRQRFTAVLITHDCAEAITLADRVIMLDRGTVALEIRVSLARPRDRSDGAFAALEGRLLRRILLRKSAAVAGDTAIAEKHQVATPQKAGANHPNGRERKVRFVTNRADWTHNAISEEE
jgi:sulfonate transport system ATP-binding protein